MRRSCQILRAVPIADAGRYAADRKSWKLHWCSDLNGVYNEGSRPVAPALYPPRPGRTRTPGRGLGEAFGAGVEVREERWRGLHGDDAAVVKPNAARMRLRIIPHTTNRDIADRLLRHATVLQIEGENYRVRGHRASINQLPGWA
jgi:hypothetical protein